MKTFFKILSWALIAVLAAALPIVLSHLPINAGEKIRVVNNEWAGVLRIWLCPGFEPGGGSFTPWLNEQLARFEKKHSGVYVQIINASPDMIRAFAAGDTNPPDIMLFSPGMLTSPSALAPIVDVEIQADLQSAGKVNGVMYACPIALGGYAWIYNAAYLQSIPADFRTLPALKGKGKEVIYYINCAADGPFMSWSGALMSLMSDRTVVVGGAPEATARAGEGVDLGLPQGTKAPTAESVERTEVIACYLPEALPENFRADASVYGDFTAGRAAVIPGTQREIRRLQLLSDSGRAPDFRVEAVGAGFTDQLLMYAVVDYPRTDAEARQALGMALLNFLLTEESQRKLDTVRAFPVIETGPMYAGQAGMAALEHGMMREVSVPNAFDANFRKSMRAEADALYR